MIADADALRGYALAYVGRYATTRARLASYLRRKLREAQRPDLEDAIPSLVERCVALGFVDDSAFAAMRTQALERKGFGARRIEASLRQAGIDSDTAQRSATDADPLELARTFARKRRFGPYGSSIDLKTRQKQFAAMMRAGHSPAIAARLLGERPEDLDELDMDHGWP